MKKLLVLLILMIGSFSLLSAQTPVNIVSDNGQSISTCDGSFSVAGYSTGTTYTVTICSNDALDRHITLTNGSYTLPEGASLTVHDGDDETADILAVWDHNSTSATVAAYASNTNESGCLTLVFTSSVSGASFTGDIGCQFLCPAPILVDIVSSSPEMVNEEGTEYTNLCWDYDTDQSDPVTFTGAGTYPTGAGYALNDANVTYTWNFNDGSDPVSGLGLTEVTHTFPNQQGYTILLTIEDSQGCTNTNSATHRVRVARTPLWSSQSFVDPAEICMGEPVQMCAAYGTVEWNSSIVPEVSEAVNMPDGNDVCYTAGLTQNQFLPNQTLESVNDLIGVFMNIEHSFLGDLTFAIQCPNGQSVQLQAQGGGGTHLGEPIDAGSSDNNAVPGVGYWYSFSPNGTQTLTEAATSVSTLPAGDYASSESLTGLVGCPLNGQWTLTVCDNWLSDDGWMFGWYLEFDESLFPDTWSYTPDYSPLEWSGLYGSSLDNPIDDDCITGTYLTTDNPTENSDQPLFFTLEDQFGCEHDTTMYVTVLHEDDPTCCVQPEPSAGNNTNVCGLTTFMNASNPAAGNNGFWEEVSGPGTAVFADNTNPNSEVTVDIPGSYEFSWTEQFEGNPACETTETVTIQFEALFDPTITPIDDMCRNDQTFEIDVVDFGTITANPNIPGIENGIINPSNLEPGTSYTITNTAPGTCYTSESDTETFEVYDEIQLINFNDQECFNGTEGQEYEVEFTVVGSDGGTPVNNYTVNGTAQTNANFFDTHASQTPYSYVIQDVNGCSSIEIQGERNCGCPSPGTMTSLAIVNLCGNECTGDYVDHNGNDYHPTGLDYVIGYILHQGDIENPIAYNATEPDFCKTGDINYDELYYVSAVVSTDDNSNGEADPSEPCYSAAQGTPVRWKSIPIPNAGTEASTCELVIQLDADTLPAGQVGYWTSTCNFVAVQGTNYHDPDMVANVNDYGDCVFTWNVVNGNCISSDDVVIHFNQSPIPFAGNDTIVCGTEVQLSTENSIPGSTFQWSGNANFNPTDGATTTASVNNTGTYEFTLTEYNGACFNQDKVKVTFIPQPQPSIVANVDTVCGTSTCLEVDNVNGSGYWSATADGGVDAYFDDNTDPNTCVTINYSGTYREVEFVWTETNEYQGVQCENTASRNIVFAKVPNAFVGNDNNDEVCGNTYTFDADTTGTGWATMYWMGKSNISYTIDDNTIPNASVTINPLTSFGDSAHVTVPFQWVVSSGGGCADIDTMWVTFYQEPIANAGLDNSVCGLQYELEAFYSLPNTDSYDPNGAWSNPSGNPSSVNFINSQTNQTLVNVGAPGVYDFVWTERNDNNTSCTSKDTVTITFKEQPVIDAGDDFDVCGNTATLSATTSGFDLTWQSTTGGVNFDDYTSAETGVQYGGYGPVTFTVGEANDECTSIDQVTVHFWREPSAEHSVPIDDTTQCGRVFTRLRAENPGAGVVGNWISDPSNGVNFYQNNYIDTMEVLNYGHYTVWWTESTGPDNEDPGFCSDTSEPFTIHFIEQPQANAGPDVIFCGYDGTMNAELSINNGVSFGSWFNVSANITFDDNLNPNTDVTSNVLTADNPSYDNFEFVWTENNYGCTSSDTIVVGFARIPLANLTIIPPRCEGEPASIKAQEDSLQNYDWSFPNSPGYQIDSVWVNDLGGEYRRLVSWESDDTAHVVSLSVENHWGCSSLTVQDTIYEPYRPEFEIVTYPDTCALGLGAFEFIPDSTTEFPSFSWFNAEGIEQPVTIGDTIYNIYAGTYDGTHQYRTFNSAWITQYIELFGSEQCIDEFEFIIDTAGVVVANFAISAATDMNALVAPNAEVIFDNLSDGDDVRTSCTWYFGDGESTNSCDDQVIHVYTDPNECYEPYLVIRVRDLPECRDTAFHECIIIDDMSQIEIPNIFTPNGDGMNDFFQVKAQTLQSFQGVIVNRWGRTVYEWTNYETMEAGWDGKMSGGGKAAAGVYYYIINAVGMDGVEYEEYGPFHLVREK